MATLALSVAGQVVGGAVGGPFGATIGRALGALAGNALDQMLFGETASATQGSDIRLTGSSEGGAVPRLYGWGRLSGNIIWATELEEMSSETRGAKGTGSGDGTEIVASFAVALCQGEVQHLGRIWADGEVLETADLTIRFYPGSETQEPDSLIAAKQGAGGAPAYRGLSYLVFERLPLSGFGNRIPQISVELCRVVGELEPLIRSVTIIPGATEFGYDPVARVRVLRPGTTESENAHLSTARSDWTLSIEELLALCPNLEHVALVTSWFGDDLRAGSCTIRPKVEAAARTVKGTSWSVAGLTRGAAQVVSSHDGAPAYGGTPSDAALLAAIADLKARGLAVTLYPMLLMDIAEDNSLGQPAYPWRGRIGAEDGAGAAAAVAAFMGTGSGWDYRRFIAHNAALAATAGADALIVGSELVGLGHLRDVSGGFPFVTALTGLVAATKAAHPELDLVYAADWSEYSGFSPPEAPGDRRYPLDPLFAHPAIAAVGIDNYLPLCDWREGEDHADFALADGPWDLDYLAANVAGGEGFDWYYASDADRLSGTRTPITDGAYSEPWIWRVKDIAAWWANPHHERIGGVRAATPTAWVPKGKQIWFTELGCAAVDKGANQPNVFPDAKSAEGGLPFFSSGAPDALMQRQALRAQLRHWTGTANPVSPVYGGTMVRADRISLWTWDARPFPAFPALSEVWADAANHATGHWLTGRLGGLAADELLAAIGRDLGLELVAERVAPPFVMGLPVTGLASGREMIEPLLLASGLDLAARTDGVALVPARPREGIVVDDPVAGEDSPRLQLTRGDPGERVGRLAVNFAERLNDYQSASLMAVAPEGEALESVSLPFVLDRSEARGSAERLLAHRTGERETLNLSLPLSALALDVGDRLSVTGLGPFVVTEIRDAAAREVTAKSLVATPRALVSSLVTGGRSRPVATTSSAEVAVMALPPDPASPERARLGFAAYASPWPGLVDIVDAATGVRLIRLDRPAVMGEVATALLPGAPAVWDRASFEVTLYSGHLADEGEEAVLAGANRLAIETDAGGWEIIGFAEAELVAERRYRLSRLLRGLDGSDVAIGPVSAGRRVVLLDAAVGQLDLPEAWIGAGRALRVYSGASDAEGAAVELSDDLATSLLLPPAHLAARRSVDGTITLRWIRRSRGDSGSWALSEVPLEAAPEAYRLRLFDGATPKREVVLNEAAFAYLPAAQIADFGAPATSFTFEVCQLSPTLGAGHAAVESFHA